MKHFLTLCIGLLLAYSGIAQTNPYPFVLIDSIQFVNAQKLSNGNDLPDYSNATYGDTVQFEGVVTFNPQYYGLSKNRKACFIQRDGGIPWSGVEVMMDTTIFNPAPTQADLNNTLKFYDNMEVGLTVRCTGVITNFPASNTQSGHTQVKLLQYETIIGNNGNSTPLDPKELTIDQFQKNVNGTQQYQPTTGEQWEGVYVEFKNVTVTNRSQGTGTNAARWFWSVKDKSGNIIRIRDYSAYIRNDDNEYTYVANTFAPPADNAYLQYIRGIIVENISSNGVIEYMLAPVDLNDIGPDNTYAPPTIGQSTRNISVPNSTQSVDISTFIYDDTLVASANLYYTLGYANTTFTKVAMTDMGDSTWRATIQAQPDQAYVKFYIEATDNSGFTSIYPDQNGTGQDYRVHDNGIDKISLLQYSPFPNGNSMWDGDTLSGMSLEGVVTSTLASDNLGVVAIQDGTGPFAGLFLRSVTGDGTSALQLGDRVKITKGIVTELGGCTYLAGLSGNFSVVSSGNALPAFSSVSMDSLINKVNSYSEPFEGMLVRYDNVFVTSLNPDVTSNFGEWGIYSDSSSSKFLRVDDQSNAIGPTYNVDSLTLKQPMTFLQGVLTFSFGNWKMWPRNFNDFDMNGATDKVAPVITLKGNNPENILLNTTYTDAGATAMDNKDGDITSKLVPTNGVDATKVGSYTYCYDVKDAAGNSAVQVCRQVNVYDPTGIMPLNNDVKLTVFPNPTAGDFTLRMQTNGNSMQTVTVIDAGGRMVWTQTATALPSQTWVIPTSDWHSGLYLVRCGTTAVKILVQ